MKQIIIFLIMATALISVASAEWDYQLGDPVNATGSANTWCDCGNGFQYMGYGQTFISPITGNITGLKYFQLFATEFNGPATTMWTMMGPTNTTTHLPIMSQQTVLVPSKPVADFIGYNDVYVSWNFTTPFPVTKGTEYSFWWDGARTYSGYHTTFCYVNPSNSYIYGGQLYWDQGLGPQKIWYGGSPLSGDLIVNLTYSGDQPPECIQQWQCDAYTECIGNMKNCTSIHDHNDCGFPPYGIDLHTFDTSCGGGGGGTPPAGGEEKMAVIVLPDVPVAPPAPDVPNVPPAPIIEVVPAPEEAKLVEVCAPGTTGTEEKTVYSYKIITNYEKINVPFYVREESSANTCGMDADQDGNQCDLNEDFISCPKDCGVNVQEFTCTDPYRCAWTEEWLLKIVLVFQLMLAIYLIYAELR